MNKDKTKFIRVIIEEFVHEFGRLKDVMNKS